MTSFLTFILFMVGSALLFTYLMWRINGRPDGDFRSYLRIRYEQFKERRAESSTFNSSNLKVIRSKDLPEAAPRTPGDHDELTVEKSTRDQEIEKLNKLYGDS
jgi:uncharacterized protein (DUF58 family)